MWHYCNIIYYVRCICAGLCSRLRDNIMLSMFVLCSGLNVPHGIHGDVRTDFSGTYHYDRNL